MTQLIASVHEGANSAPLITDVKGNYEFHEEKSLKEAETKIGILEPQETIQNILKPVPKNQLDAKWAILISNEMKAKEKNGDIIVTCMPHFEENKTKMKILQNIKK